MITLITLLSWILNNRRVPILDRRLLLLLLNRVGMSVTHSRIVEVVYGWVYMTQLSRPFHQDWSWCCLWWSHRWWMARWTSSIEHLSLKVSHGLHAWDCRG